MSKAQIIVGFFILIAGHAFLRCITDWGFMLRNIVVIIIGGFLLYLMEGFLNPTDKQSDIEKN